MCEASDCQTVIMENDPADEREVKAEVDYLYRNVLSAKIDRPVQRLHFFQGVAEETADYDPVGNRYLGFCDLRPLPGHPISLALLDTLIFSKTKSDFLYIVCKKDFSVQVKEDFPLQTTDGLFRVHDAFPYVQQDGFAITCAHASFAAIAKFYDMEMQGPDFAKIRHEVQPWAKCIEPGEGMYPDHIAMGWKKLEKDPYFISYQKSIEPEEAYLQRREQVIYRHMESNLPVLIGVDAGSEGHALVVIGHTFTPDSWLAQTETAYYGRPKSGDGRHHCNTNWVEKFVVQDDNLGPYTLIPASFLKFGCNLISVGLPENVYFYDVDVESTASLIASDIIHVADELFQEKVAKGGAIPPDTEFWRQEFKKFAQNEELVLRTFLKDKEQWMEQALATDSSKEYEDLLRSLPLPDSIWVVEISWPTIFRHQRKYCGEIVFDPTHHPLLTHSNDFEDLGWLWIHIPGIVFWKDVKNNDTGVLVLETSDPVREHMRT